jgi:mRNA-degrading endonuclease YafQ of YafQ-DinJ toxin-antitoxin module
MQMNFKSTTEFQKDLKKLSKKFRSLDEDLIEFKKVLNEAPLGIGKHFNVIIKTGIVYIVKARFFCKSLKKKDLRVIYAYIENHQIIELVGIEFIELYFKGNKENEDRERIKDYLKNNSINQNI